MNNLLIFFAIPVATIILSIIFETLIKCPFKIAGIAFSIFLLTAFALGGTVELLLLAIVYTIISFISAYLTSIFENKSDDNNCNNNATSEVNNSISNILNSNQSNNNVCRRFR